MLVLAGKTLINGFLCVLVAKKKINTQLTSYDKLAYDATMYFTLIYSFSYFLSNTNH